MANVDYIDRYILRIDEEINNKDSIPGGMPDWIMEELVNARKMLSDKSTSDEDVNRVCIRLDNDIFYFIRALREEDVSKLRNYRDELLKRDDRVADEMAQEVWDKFGPHIG